LQINQLKKKIKRVRPMWNLIDATSQRILTQTYVLSRIRYTTPITYSLMAPTTRKSIESAVRSMVRNVFNAS
jgi:hypothetical protein